MGPEGDLLRGKVLRRLRRLIRTGNCLGILAAPPCTTYSIARRPALRSRQWPEGRPGLVGKDREAVR
eukprot:6068391-Lingulodinium_polyedra.AAC.1